MLVTGQMNLGGEPAPRPAEGMVVRFAVEAVGGISPRSGGVDMRPAGSRVHGDVPSELSLAIGSGLKGGFDLCPGAG